MWADEHRIGVAAGVDPEIVEGLRQNFTGECTEVGMYLAMSRQADREGYPEIAEAYKRFAFEEAEHAAKSVSYTHIVPASVTIPLLQHMGTPCTPTVKVRDEVKVGQLLADSDAFMSVPIHSSVSGTVTAIEDFINSNGVRTQTIVIACDGQQTVDAVSYTHLKMCGSNGGDCCSAGRKNQSPATFGSGQQ